MKRNIATGSNFCNNVKAWVQSLELKLRNEKKVTLIIVNLELLLEEYRDNVSINKKGADIYV